jgi:hypothetical protein
MQGRSKAKQMEDMAPTMYPSLLMHFSDLRPNIGTILQSNHPNSVIVRIRKMGYQ